MEDKKLKTGELKPAVKMKEEIIKAISEALKKIKEQK